MESRTKATPGFEGQALATEMARHLMEIAPATLLGIRILAIIVREKNASNHILQKHECGDGNSPRIDVTSSPA
jgi:hypothetical protein